MTILPHCTIGGMRGDAGGQVYSQRLFGVLNETRRQ